MKRRAFVQTAAAASVAGLASPAAVAQPPSRHDAGRGESFAIDDNKVTFFTNAVPRPVNVMIVADTHLFTDDQRGEPYQEFSGRMAKAYNSTTHVRTGKPTNPEQCFEEALARAETGDIDLLALVGDIFSFPSEAAIEWVTQRLAAIQTPWLYVAGNHDWHYEGMDGTLDELRAEWIERRLKPLYQGRNPLMAAYDLHGVRFVAIDNSHYEILPEQLEFFRTQVSRGQPMVLLVHIPLYAAGRSMGFGCGNPEWSAATDRNFKIERRPRWPESGHTQTTLDFHREVFEAANLMGVFAGHIHRQSVDVVNGIPQFVTNANAVGAFMDIRFEPQV
ncbi:Calcineurin-like phosphoesterase superfamily domain protein [Rubripirellula lacrimiformis]|uniref:Calcineurin-like phosphoesterase superfamily domain protein n=1 Tax=Rubripirellula lacrimiformis TaxID=1930273 RepID=A0A517N4W1_9BACT|nr:metallophosphoesterase [Rubripirellula lacrimiformis]QDT02179.1 Calcineurin-like phosphoesterase superfamily domain protein [Rubripirellula lacrimiformis]